MKVGDFLVIKSPYEQHIIDTVVKIIEQDNEGYYYHYLNDPLRKGYGYYHRFDELPEGLKGESEEVIKLYFAL